MYQGAPWQAVTQICQDRRQVEKTKSDPTEAAMFATETCFRSKYL